MELRSSEPGSATLRASATVSENEGSAAASFRNSEQAREPLRNSEQVAARMLDEAFTAAGLDTKEIAHLCDVTPSLVEKWRSTEQRGCPSFAQLLMLPPSFHFQLHRAMNRHYGFGRQLLARVLDDLGAVALAVGE
jgi:hypothetical protein